MNEYQLQPIGTVKNDGNGAFIQLKPEYAAGLKALEGFSHINVLWWFSDCDDPSSRSVLQTEKPYKGGPETIGIFATRSPFRPNPIALTAAEMIRMDPEQGLVQLTFIDADNNTPVLDIKPYTPSLDRVETPEVPAWCSGWPKSTEESGHFDWEQIFNF